MTRSFLSYALVAAFGAAPLSADTTGQALLQALRNGDTGSVRAAIENGANVETPDEYGNTLLMHVAVFGNAADMEFLLGHGANVNAVNRARHTPLMRAVPDLAKIRLLVEHGANVNAAAADGTTPLMTAAHVRSAVEVVRYLVARGADLQPVDRRGFDAIMIAAEKGAFDNLKVLLDAGARGGAKATNIPARKGTQGTVFAGPVLDLARRRAEGVTALMNAAQADCEPCVRLLLEHGNKAEAQRLIDVMFWRGWRVFALLTGAAMDYYTPLPHRRLSFKEFMLEWIIKQFNDQLRDLGLERPWYWELFLQELDWLHHALHLGTWFKRLTVWWNPDAGVSFAEREWLEAKYPGWHDRFGTFWQTIAENVRNGNIAHTHQETLFVVCNLCQIPMCSPTIGVPPQLVTYNGRVYTFCSDPCRWIFEQNPARYAGHLSIIDRFLGGLIQPPDSMGVLAYMGLTPAEQGTDAMNCAWAYEQASSAAASAA